MAVAYVNEGMISFVENWLCAEFQTTIKRGSMAVAYVNKGDDKLGINCVCAECQTIKRQYGGLCKQRGC